MREERPQKRALVMGLADARSIAGGIIQAMVAEGWDVVATAHSHPTAFKMAQQRGLKKLGLEGKVELLPCNVEMYEEIADVSRNLFDRWPEGFDYLVHAIAFSDKKELQGDILDTSYENMIGTMDISAYSLVKVCKVFEHDLRENGSVLALTFAGSRFNAPNYNGMGAAKAALESYVRGLAGCRLAKRGIRVNALSAGPVLTMSASAIGDFVLSLFMGVMRSVFGRNVTQEELGKAALHILQMPGVTGSVIDVDNGIHLAGMGSTPREMAMVAEHLARIDDTCHAVKADEGTPV